MAEFSLDRFKYRWRGDWSAGQSYLRDDIVRVNGKSYVCLKTHTADALFRTDLNAILPDSDPPQPDPKWVVMTSGRMFAGTWATDTAYNKGDIVNFQGSLYICINSHSSTTFPVDAPYVDYSIEPVDQNWRLFVAGQKFLSVWTTDTDYGLGALVKYSGNVYKAVETHNSGSAFEDNFNKWELFYDGYEFKNNWLPDTKYVINDLVKYGASIFKCIETHTSNGSTLDDDKFEIEMIGSQNDGEWSPLVAYNQGDVVRYGGVLYYAINNNIDKNPSDNFTYDSDDSTNYWIVFSSAYNFRSIFGEVDLSTEFRVVTVGDDTVDEKTTGNFYIDGVERKPLFLKKGVTYIFEQSNSSNATFDNKTNPICFSTRENGVAGGGEYYEVANPDAVKYIQDGYEVSRQTYFDNFSTAATKRVSLTIPTTEALTLYYFSGVNLEMGASITTVNPPTSIDFYAQSYKTGDVVQRGGNVYRAVRDVNISEGDLSSIDYLDPEVWELLVPGKLFASAWEEGNYYSLNSVATYLGTAYICTEEHRSADNNFPGDNGSGYDYWDTLIEAGQPGALNAIGDLLTYGLSREPIGDLSTVGSKRLGIGETDDLLSVHLDNTSEEMEIFWRKYDYEADVIYVAEHGQDETGYGISWDKPFRTVRHACEFVEDNFAANTPVKISVATGRFEEIGPISVPAGSVIMGDELRATNIVASGPKAAYDDTFKYINVYMTRLKQLFPQLILLQTATLSEENPYKQDKTGPISSTASYGDINQLIDDYILFIDANLGSGEAPDITGSNNPTSSTSNVNAAAILERNVELIAKELILAAQAEYPNDTLPEAEMREDIRHFLRAIKRDLNYSGNWATQMSAQRYYNSVLGSKQTNLLYMRDNTGLRNLSTAGLEGVLNPPGVFSQYQRPTGGSLVSLDPGWGPDDERVWIKTRSPYMQGITNVGTACVGCKIDGSLHNGGLKSMVANDFTQVLSDGIGAWVANNARAELVSVFTYYCQVGYLAEGGGVIRAANGNNSYGSFGSIAEGNDATETPNTVTVNNRENQAVVNNAIAGGSGDELLTFEYAHCGAEYSYADADIIGAGADADIEYSDFRDGALFEARLINTKGSGSKGGSNYTISQNSAQVTLVADDQIILNVNESTQFEEEIQGMRIVLIEGTGVGQYAIVDTYDQPSKVLTVIKESDGTAGWDHVIPGWPIETSLDSTTKYRIEPRMTCAAPPTTENFSNLPSARTWADIGYGYTTATYSGITIGSGTGQVDEEAASFNAVISVTRKGDTYSATLQNPGAGYAVGDTLTVNGSDLGGTTPENNMTFVVTENSDDSTNSIVDFKVTGTPRGKRWVAITTDGIFAYSDDGETWLEGNLPSGAYVKMIAEDDRFLALATDESWIAHSLDGQTWTQRSLGATGPWKDIIYGKDTNGTAGRFVIVGVSQDAPYSDNGLNWSLGTLPAGDDSTGQQWTAVAYGQGRYVAVSSSQERDVAYSTDGATWSVYNQVIPTGLTEDVMDVVYGRNRFLLMTYNGEVLYSLDKGETWLNGADAPTQDGSTTMAWKRIKYNQGVFMAICDTGGKVIGLDETAGPTTFYATTEDGVLWTQRAFSYENSYSALGVASINNKPIFAAMADNATGTGIGYVGIGARAKVRADITSGSFNLVKIWDPGSGYDASNKPLITIVDENYVTAVEIDLRLGNGVLAQPDFIDRGAGYRTSSSTITIEGNGYADIIPEDNLLVLSGVTLPIPGPGVQIRLTGILDENTEDPDDLKLFVGVKSEDLGDDGSGNGTRKVRFTISPALDNEYNLAHGTVGTLRVRYSQCRISGHDFLDIGTGNFEDTNYPELYAGGRYFTAAPENEVSEIEGGRVFYVSTDQDGNFRAGELFGVNQATGVVTISAEFFDLDGLSSLALGGVRLGGTGTVVNEFSTDPTFSADSNNIIPTQKAIATFLADRLSVGGSDLETNSITAGQVKIGTSDNIVDILGGGYLNIPRRVTFDGADANGNLTNVQGNMLAQMMFMRAQRVNDQ